MLHSRPFAKEIVKQLGGRSGLWIYIFSIKEKDTVNGKDMSGNLAFNCTQYIRNNLKEYSQKIYETTFISVFYVNLKYFPLEYTRNHVLVFNKRRS